MVRPGISAADHGEFDAIKEEGLVGSIGPFLKQYQSVKWCKCKSEILSKGEELIGVESEAANDLSAGSHW